MLSPSPSAFQQLTETLAGELHLDAAMRTLYATDASVYREMPQAVALPKSEEDIIRLIQFARDHGTALVPRTAGTSLAGQVVGSRILFDVSRPLTQVFKIAAVLCPFRR